MRAHSPPSLLIGLWAGANAHSQQVTFSPTADISHAPHPRIQCDLGRGNGRVCLERVARGSTKLGCYGAVDPSLLDDATLTGDTSLSLGQVVFCLRRMLTMVTPGQDLDPEISPPWHADWFSSAELGFPLALTPPRPEIVLTRAGILGLRSRLARSGPGGPAQPLHVSRLHGHASCLT